jgi:hypothetical protein
MPEIALYVLVWVTWIRIIKWVCITPTSTRVVISWWNNAGKFILIPFFFHLAGHNPRFTPYITMNKFGNIWHCPQNQSYYQSCEQCVGEGSSCPDGGKEHSKIVNPCTLDNLLKGNFFFTYPPDVTKFIHCDVWGKPWVMTCQMEEEWDQNELTCIVPSAYNNPCRSIFGLCVGGVYTFRGTQFPPFGLKTKFNWQVIRKDSCQRSHCMYLCGSHGYA